MSLPATVPLTGDPRDRLLQAAIALFGEHGYRGATTRRIAEAAGVNEVTLFRLFGSKQALLDEAVERMQDEVASTADRSLPDEPVDVPAELLAWSGVHWRAMREQAAGIRKMLSEADEHEHMRQCMGEGWSRTHATLARYLQRLKDRGDLAADLDIRTAVAMLSSVLFADAIGRDHVDAAALPSERHAVAQYLTLYLRALGHTPRTALTSA
jgi:AcrR family transcriptional regulator